MWPTSTPFTEKLQKKPLYCCLRTNKCHKESSLRSQQYRSQSNNSMWFRELKGSLSYPQQPTNAYYPVPDKSNPRTPSKPISLRSTLILYSHLRLGHLRSLCLSVFPAHLPYTFHFSSLYAPRPIQLVSPLLITRTELEGVQIIKLLPPQLRNSLQPPVNSSLLIFSSAPCSRTPSVSSLPQFEGPSFKPYTATSKILSLLILDPILNTLDKDEAKRNSGTNDGMQSPKIHLLLGPL